MLFVVKQLTVYFMPLKYVCCTYKEKIEFVCSLSLENGNFYCTVCWDSPIYFPCNLLAIITCEGSEENNCFFSIQNRDCMEKFRIAPVFGASEHNLILILSTGNTMIEILNASFKTRLLPSYSGVSVITGIEFNLQSFSVSLDEGSELDRFESFGENNTSKDQCFNFVGDEKVFGCPIPRDSYSNVVML